MNLTEIIQAQVDAVAKLDDAGIYPRNKVYVVTSCNNCPHSKITIMAIGYNAVYCTHPDTKKENVLVEAAANTVPVCCPLDDMK